VIYQLGNVFMLGRPGRKAKAVVKRVPSPDKKGRGAPKYVPASGRIISKKAELVANPTALLVRKLDAVIA
jgi:hypothetical protein